MNSISKKLSGRMLAVILAAAALVLLAGCAQSAPETQPETTEVTAPPAPAIVLDEDAAPLDLETPYGVMQYPSQWEEYVTVDENSDGGLLTETFCCEISGKQIELFTIYFGESLKGERLGYVTAEGVKTEIRLEFHEYVGGGLPQEDESKIYAMQEAVNDVIRSIKAFEGYSAQ